MKKALLLLLLLSFQAQVFAWDGYDYNSGNSVEIRRGNLVRPGRTVEVYDYGTGQYKDMEVNSVRRSGSHVNVEVYDSDAGETREFEMDGD